MQLIDLRETLLLKEDINNMIEKVDYNLVCLLLSLYFGQDYNSRHFKKPDMYAINLDFALYINYVILEYIFWENEIEMWIDERDMYVCYKWKT
jgi:hypothetical protein